MKLRVRKSVRRTTMISMALFGLLLGIFAAKFGVEFYWWYGLLAILLGIVTYKKRPIALVALFSIGLIIGLARGHIFYQDIQQYNSLYGKKVVMTGTVVDDTGYDERRQTEFHVGDVQINAKNLPGKVRVRALSASEVSRGDTVMVEGTLRPTIGTSRQGSFSFASVKVLQNETGWSESIRNRFFAAVYSVLPDPQASLGLGYLVGVRSALPSQFSDQLAVVGLTHIVAVSGYNLTIIIQGVKRILEKRSAYQTLVFSFALIAGFIVMTGWSPSIMRAAIISVFGLLAWYYGREFKPVLLILLGAAITALISPLYVWGDVGWYLSFLAFSGVLILAPLVTSFIYRKKQPNFLIMILIETLCAQIMTVPYIAVIFGRISLISPLANLLVVPFIPITMLLVFLVGIIGMFSPVIALWPAVLPHAFLTFAVWIVQILSKISFAQVAFKPSWVEAAVMYSVIMALIILLWRWYKKRHQLKQVDVIDWNLV